MDQILKIQVKYNQINNHILEYACALKHGACGELRGAMDILQVDSAFFATITLLCGTTVDSDTMAISCLVDRLMYQKKWPVQKGKFKLRHYRSL